MGVSGKYCNVNHATFVKLKYSGERKGIYTTFYDSLACDQALFSIQQIRHVFLPVVNSDRCCSSSTEHKPGKVYLYFDEAEEPGSKKHDSRKLALARDAWHKSPKPTPDTCTPSSPPHLRNIHQCRHYYHNLCQSFDGRLYLHRAQQ